ncbi:hypothetical protein E2F43_15320 [Seongchinamella unica]|uniref:Uncharacterized protein n=1 Tax=Seongchinamella unica TaxID=2547392 RepID=A0A4R5LQS2_9GAMM|nr:hypothetical protein [Seongchinamella unica]TDG12922.1 hypothetical protein E2F43_15320 [Seongchinamella unica]
MKIWLVPLLLVSAVALAQEEQLDEVPVAPEADSQQVESEEPPINWVDTSHTAVADQAQAMVEWMDGFFGDPNYDLDKAASYLRLEFENDWEQNKGNDLGVRLRGKVQLPKISQRVDLLFSDEEGDTTDQEEREDSDNVSLQYNVRKSTRSRFDATMGFSSGNLKPGVRYRIEGDLDFGRRYRYIQRIQYEDGEKFFTIGQADLYQSFNTRDVLRWSNRLKWGETTEGVEWRTRLSLFQRFAADTDRPLALNHFVSVRGESRPTSFIKNYRLGTIWRRQVYRDFLFLEMEPAMNYRRRDYEDSRDLSWSFVIRLEIALSRDFSRGRSQDREDERAAADMPVPET